MQKISNINPARVALVSGCVALGGSTTFLINLGGEFVRRGIPVEVLSFEKENPLGTDFSRRGIPTICLDDRRLILEDRVQLALDQLQRFQPTVVLSNLGTESFEVQRYLPTGIFRIGVAHSDDPPIYPGIARYAKHLDTVAVVSRTMKQKMEAQPELARTAIHYLPCGVPIPEKARERKDGILRPLQVLYLGRLENEQKRTHLFPQILDQLKKSGISFHWTIAGDGSERMSLEQMMKSSPAQTVSFLGEISYEQVPGLLRRHDVYLLASDYEGLPLSLLEAMGEGLVPVISDLPSGIPEVVNDSNGILVPIDDMAGYARGIIHLHEHRSELAAKSLAARSRVEAEFSVEAMTDRWLSVFPKKFSTIGDWPARGKILAPLPARHPIYFSPPMRVIRRLAMKFQH